MKHNLLKSVILSVILLMGVSNAWGKTSFYLNANDTYWNKEGTKFSIHYTTDGTDWSFSNFMVKISGDFYTTTVDADNVKTIVAVHHNSSATTPTWENKWNQTNNIDISSTKNNLIKITGWDQANFTIESYGKHQNEAQTVYFDNSFSQWDQVFLRVGTGEMSASAGGYNQAYKLSKVPGTEHLYKGQFPKWRGYGSYNFADNCGWTNENNIYQPFSIYHDDYKMEGQTEYAIYELEDKRLFVPYEVYPTIDYECKDYKINSYNTHTQTVTFSQHTAGGTVVISYIDENGDEQNVSDGSFTVAQTCILKVESVDPKEGYKFNQVSFYDGTNYHTKAIGETFIVRAGTTIYPEFVTSETNKVYFKLSDEAYTDWTAAASRIAVYAWYNEYIDGTTPATWIEMEKVPNKDNLYRCVIPAGYKRFSFVRLCPSGHQNYNSNNNGFNWNNKWNQSLDQEFTQVIAGKNCLNLTTKTTDNDQNEKYTGDWIASKVYLDPNAYCTYGITCNDKDRYLNHATEERMIELPYGSSLKIVDAYDISPYYMPNPRYATSVVINRAYETDKNSLILYDEIRYSANIVTKETQRVYLHLPSSLKNEWINGTTGNDWFNCIYLRDYLSHGRTLDPEQNNGSNIEYGKVVKGFSHESFDANEDEYWYIDIPAGFNAFGFERKNSTGQGTGFANRTIEFEYEIPLDGVDNCFTISGEKDGGRYTGSWGPLPKCTVELGYCEFGTHGIKYKGQEYFANHNETTNTKVIVSYGDEVEVLPGQPMRSDAYTNHAEQWIDKNPNDNKSYDTKIKTFDKFDGVENKVTITEKTLFDDCFLTKEPHDVYIGIPNTGMDNIWYQEIPNENGVLGDGDIYVWPITNNAGKDLAVKTEEFENDGVTYYKFTLPEGINAFYFQRKGYKGNGTTYCQSVKLLYEIPLDEENCYMLDKGKTPNSYYTGYWKSMPSDGDFRILYVEQIVTKKEQVGDEWITEVKRTYEHSSDIIKKRNTTGSDIVSLHIYTRGNNPEIILQQYDGRTEKKKWIDIEAHMVNGPLEATPGMGMLPGRKNAGPGSDIDDFVYDDGIEKIKNDPTDDGCGVWNFTVYQNGTSAKLDLINESGLKRYEGKYYIRTANAEGKWIDYTIPANHMTFSSYAKQHHGEYFSHYFCKWVDLDKHYNDVSFIIANDHAKSLTDPSYLFDDQYVVNQWLPENANIRWGWSIINNKVSRAYIAGSYEGANDFLVVNHPKNDTKVKLQKNINEKDGYFNDNTNWLYYADLLAQPEAKVQVYAKYNEKFQYFMGEENVYTELIGGDYDNDKRYYPIRILYDFKEHRFVVGYHPEEQIEGKDVAIETPVMLIRRHHDAPNQISFDNTALNPLKIEAPMPAYGVITFLEEKLTSDEISKNEKMFYWVSFPFDVRISHVFGLGEYGSHWVMEEYDGEARAEEGWNIYNTFWRYITDTATTLEAGKGYVLCLNYNRVINEAFLSDKNEEISLYFPSIETVDQSTIQSRGEKEVPIPTWTGAAPQKDHNWNLIGAISYANTGEKTQQSNSKFLYEYQPADDTYSPRASNGYTFNALHAYMVQYAGTITWTSHIAPLSIAAKRDAENDDNMHELSLDLILNGTTQDQTFIQLEDGEATQMFDLNIDMTKIINSGSNIYSISDDNNKLAGNVIPVEEAVIPLGVVTTTAGEYTFAMPNGTDGIVVELIDYETNTRTNMLLDNYTVNLGNGTFENRFALHVKPNKTTTSIVDVNTNSNGVRKFIIDGTLYMQKDGVLYDAQGRCVQ